LWWHPHNFGTSTDVNISFLRVILEHYSQLKRDFDFQSLTMQEIAATVLAMSGTPCPVS